MSFGRIFFVFRNNETLYGTLICLTELHRFMFPFRKKTRSEKNHKLSPLVLASVFPSAVF